MLEKVLILEDDPQWQVEFRDSLVKTAEIIVVDNIAEAQQVLQKKGGGY